METLIKFKKLESILRFLKYLSIWLRNRVNVLLYKTGITISREYDTMEMWGGSFSYLVIRVEIEVIGLSCNCIVDVELKYWTVLGTISIKQPAREGYGITFNEKFKARLDNHPSKLVMKSILSRYKGMD